MQTESPNRRYTHKSGLLYAIEAAGSQAKLASLLGVMQSTVSKWLALDALPRPTINAGTGIAKVIEKAGGQPQLAFEMGVTQQAVALWLRLGHVPGNRVDEIANLYGVPRAELISPKLRDAAGGAK